MERVNQVLAIDVGSTTSKALLFGYEDGHMQLLGRAAAATTVEKPTQNVMIGIRNALGRLQEQCQRPLLEEGQIIATGESDRGVDLVVATSSAGGGLQMLVTGLVRSLTAESAERAALGAGAIVTDVIAMDDARLVVERIKRVRELRPDMVLLTGGTDEGNIGHVGAMAEYIAAANPTPKAGQEFRMPVIYAGNVQAREFVTKILGDLMDVFVVDNIRPKLEEEVLGKVRDEIHRLFLNHVMAHAPGYQDLLEIAGGRIQPTPTAVGKMMERLADRYETDVVGLDIGGATTDVFSVTSAKYHRSVSANLGMSYSLGNVLVEASPERILSWLPFEFSEGELRNWNFNKMIRPASLPETIEELMVEHALAREAIRLSFEHHMSLAVTLKGIRTLRTMDEVFDQKPTGQPLIDMLKVGALIGSGGVLAYAPRPAQAAMLLNDALEPEGITRLFLDAEFMLPQLGALAEVAPHEAEELLISKCLLPLGTVVAPVGKATRYGRVIATVKVEGRQDVNLAAGQLLVLPLGADEEVAIEVRPKGGYDLGAGRNRVVEAKVQGGEVGLILDGRGRPLVLPTQEHERRLSLRTWLEAMGVYPEVEGPNDKGVM